MKNVFPIMKLNDKYTLVERKRDDGTVIEYVICNGLKPVENGEPNEYEWVSGRYSFTLEGAIKDAALNCFKPIYQYTVIEFDSDGDISSEVFDDYDKAHHEMEIRHNRYRNSDGATYGSYEAGIDQEEGLIRFGDEYWIKLKLIETRI